MITEPHYSPASRLRVVAQRLLTAGIIAHVRGSFSTQALTEIGDALLAAPIAAVLLAVSQPDALDAIRILRHRGREHMLVLFVVTRLRNIHPHHIPVVIDDDAKAK